MYIKMKNRIRIVQRVGKLPALKYTVYVNINATDCVKASLGISDVVLNYLSMKEQPLFNNIEDHRNLTRMEKFQKLTQNG
jgi:hypothetical protein